MDGVKNSPTTPRTPETPIFRRCSRCGSSGTAAHLLQQLVEQGPGRRSALLADHADDGLGLADANVEPPVGPLHADAVHHVRLPRIVAARVALAQVREQLR